MTVPRSCWKCGALLVRVEAGGRLAVWCCVVCCEDRESDHIDTERGALVTVGVGPVERDNRRPVLLQVNAQDGSWAVALLTWAEARKAAAAILDRCAGLDSEEDGGAR
jgi:hypothetical protein